SGRWCHRPEVARGLATPRLTSQANEEAGSMTPPTDTDTIDIIRIVDTRVPHTSAAHATMPTSDGDTRPLTIVWSTEPFACVEFELGNVGHDGPTQFPADRS